MPPVFIWFSVLGLVLLALERYVGKHMENWCLSWNQMSLWVFVVSAMGLDFQFYCALFILSHLWREGRDRDGAFACLWCSCCELLVLCPGPSVWAVGNVCGEGQTFMTLTKRKKKLIFKLTAANSVTFSLFSLKAARWKRALTAALAHSSMLCYLIHNQST